MSSKAFELAFTFKINYCDKIIYMSLLDDLS